MIETQRSSTKKLIVSEMFYSLQGEGRFVGTPAVFLRLAACNLQCAGFSYQDPITQEHLGCDTKALWRKGTPYADIALLERLEQEGWGHALQRGAHLVVTGGEPLLQQEGVGRFLQALDAVLGAACFIELETNATIIPDSFLSQRVNQFNVSPKLRFSQEPREKAYKKDVLQYFAAQERASFKFVVQALEDVLEIIHDYQKPLHIPCQRIWLMPEGGTREALQRKMPDVATWCKTYGFNFSTRLHVHIWNEATGV